MTTMEKTSVTTSLPTADELRTRARAALAAIAGSTDGVELGAPGEPGVPVSTPVTGDVLFTVPASTPDQARSAIAEAAEAFSTRRTTPAPGRAGRRRWARWWSSCSS